MSDVSSRESHYMNDFHAMKDVSSRLGSTTPTNSSVSSDVDSSNDPSAGARAEHAQDVLNDVFEGDGQESQVLEEDQAPPNKNNGETEAPQTPPKMPSVQQDTEPPKLRTKLEAQLDADQADAQQRKTDKCVEQASLWANAVKGGLRVLKKIDGGGTGANKILFGLDKAESDVASMPPPAPRSPQVQQGFLYTLREPMQVADFVARVATYKEQGSRAMSSLLTKIEQQKLYHYKMGGPPCPLTEVRDMRLGYLQLMQQDPHLFGF